MSAVGTEGTCTQATLGILIDAYVNTTALQSMLFVHCRKRSVTIQFFLVVSFTTVCMDRVNGKKTEKRRVGKFFGTNPLCRQFP
jgi:hypothetical protein